MTKPKSRKEAMTEYRIYISVEPYKGELREVCNTFSFERASVIRGMLEQYRDKLAVEFDDRQRLKQENNELHLCIAKCWDALGIKEYNGKSLDENIKERIKS